MRLTCAQSHIWSKGGDGKTICWRAWRRNETYTTDALALVIGLSLCPFQLELFLIMPCCRNMVEPFDGGYGGETKRTQPRY